MIKIDVELELDADEILDGIDKNLKAVAGMTASEVGQKAKDLAANRLRSGYSHWEQGFRMEKLGDGEWLLYVTGKLGKMMEDGFGVGEIKAMVLGGKAYAANKAAGKDYVDIPIFDADTAAKELGEAGGGLRMTDVTSADDITKHLAGTMASGSSEAKRGLDNDRKITRKVKDMIKAAKQNRKSGARLLNIRRMTPESKGWPNKPFGGAKVLENLDNIIERAFEESLNRLL